jgi:hypothetical protein
MCNVIPAVEIKKKPFFAQVRIPGRLHHIRHEGKSRFIHTFASFLP